MPDGIVPETFGREQLPEFLRHQERQVIFRDASGCHLSLCSGNRIHGQLPDVQPESDLTVLQDFLRSVYRFGTPLPDGFHHDAQLEGDAIFTT